MSDVLTFSFIFSCFFVEGTHFEPFFSHERRRTSLKCRLIDHLLGEALPGHQFMLFIFLKRADCLIKIL